MRKRSKKLILSRETVRTLQYSHAVKVGGGACDSVTSCPQPMYTDCPCYEGTYEYSYCIGFVSQCAC